MLDIKNKIDKLNKALAPKESKVIILDINDDLTLDIRVNNSMMHFSNYQEYIDNYIDKEQQDIVIIVDDIVNG